jgi:hypothetical protein
MSANHLNLSLLKVVLAWTNSRVSVGQKGSHSIVIRPVITFVDDREEVKEQDEEKEEEDGEDGEED